MTTNIKKYLIKIPTNITIHYCNQNQILVVSKSSKRKALKLKLKVIIDKNQKTVEITKDLFSNVSNCHKKMVKSLQGTYIVLIKQMILEVSTFFCKRLNLVGVGYKVTLLDVLNTKVLHFKLGYSHNIYFKLPKSLKIHCLKANKFFIQTDSYEFVTQIAAMIRSCKVPEPYKGKGILYSTERIKLKEGKKL